MNNLKGRNRIRQSCLTALLGSMLAVAPAFAALHIEAIHGNAMPNFDVRSAQTAVSPTLGQEEIVNVMGATVRWNQFGTPQTLIRHGDFLATGFDADAVTAARQFLSANHDLFRVSADDVAAWELYHVGEFAFSDARAVKFRQTFDGQPSQAGGIVTVGVIDGNVSIVTSSIAGLAADTHLAAATIDATDALVTAAQDVGLSVSRALVSAPVFENGWDTFTVSGLVGTQRVRPMAFPTATGVHNVYETWVVSVDAGKTTAYMHLVDASTNTVLYRENKVYQYADGLDGRADAAVVKPRDTRAPMVNAFNGNYTGTACGPSATTFHGPYSSDGTEGYVSAEVAASDINAANDIVIDVYIDRDDGDGIVFLAQFDFLFSPENGTISPVEVADYYVQVCAFDNIEPIPPGAYTGTFTFNDASVPGSDPRWLHFPANPLLDLTSTDIRELGCWLNPDADTVCDFTVANLAARAPWDYDHNAGAPSLTTIGNAAISGEAWLSPLTPAEQYRPTDPLRDYSFPWTNVWNTSGCSPTNFTPGVGNDIDAAVINMFVAHNRMHDWSYHLGFTEINSNFQQRNFGNTSTDREGDPVLGNVQAGAIDGAFPAYLGRDNANFVPTPDGAPGITNQYLWQALLGAIYVPCADGNYDVGIVGHEIGHGIQHRMTGGPATGLGGTQGGEMGEGWGDLTGMEILNEYGAVPVQGESPFAIGTYVLDSPERGIRNYNMSTSPLNYSDIQYDPFGNGSPHSDGEIWSATNFRVRAALVDEHNGTHPATDAVLQRDCAEGKKAPQNCPGNRRWIQLMHDGFLLQPAAPSMLDARDAQMAADFMRFTDDATFGNHFDALWLAYARSGMGANAASTSSNDNNPTADFSLPTGHSLANADVDFVAKTVEGGAFIAAEIYIGDFEARTNPIATTATDGTPAAASIAPGTYSMLARADGHGHFRFEQTFTAGQAGTITVNMPTNFASATNGAGASGAGIQHADLLDDSEATGWEFSGQVGLLSGPDPDGVPGSQPVANPKIVTVQLAQPTLVNRVQVSALAEEGGNRFENLRQFEVWGCNDGLAVDCSNPANFGLLYQSSLDAFPGQPIRPLAPNLIIRSFDLTTSGTVTHLQFRALHNQCTGSTEFTRNDWATGAAAPDHVQDCRDGSHPILSAKDQKVTAAEFQAFGAVGFVDVAGLDTDGDGILDDVDNCVTTPNADQSDQDGDTVGDVCDNCLLEFNPDQCNTNAGTGPGQDQIGNVCDADITNNGIINSFDLTELRNNFGATGANDSDITCNGIVNSFDLTELRNDFGQAPGPSGIAP